MSSDAQTQNDGRGEDEPLLGRPGDASQKVGDSMLRNLVIGRTYTTQVGLLSLQGSGLIIEQAPQS